MPARVLVVQNSLPANNIGSATSTNNYSREVDASLGVAIFGSLFTTNLADKLTGIFTAAGASASRASGAGASLDPTTLKTLPQPIRESIVNAYADSLAPVFWYLVPFLAVAFVLALFIKQIKLSDVSGMVARGEAVNAIGAARDGEDLDTTTPDNAMDDADLLGTDRVETAPSPDDDLAGVGARGLT